jgi:hypothetical protein
MSGKTLNKEDFKKQLFNKYKNKFELIGEYKGSNTKTEFKCNQCGNIFLGIPTSLLKGVRTVERGGFQ